MDLTKWPYQKKAMRELLQETRDQTDALHRYNAQQAWQNSRVSDVTSTQRQAAFGAQQKAAREHLTALEQERLAWREEQQRILEEQAAELEAQQAEAAALTGGGQVPGVQCRMIRDVIVSANTIIIFRRCTFYGAFAIRTSGAFQLRTYGGFKLRTSTTCTVCPPRSPTIPATSEPGTFAIPRAAFPAAKSARGIFATRWQTPAPCTRITLSLALWRTAVAVRRWLLKLKSFAALACS